MKKMLICISAILFFAACASNQKTYHISMPNFKAQIQSSDANISANENAKVKISEVQIIKNTFYSSYFEQSTLNHRINKSLELLKNQLIKDAKNILQNKGYKIVEANANYTFDITINANLYEDKVTKNSSFSGDNIESSFMFILEAQNTLADLDGNTTSLTSSSKLDDVIIINYPIKSQASFDTFRQVYSAVPTQINESMSNSVLEIDNLFIKFYKELILSLQNSLPQNEKTTHKEENLEEIQKSQEESNPYQNNEVIIFQ
ncbi:hypothetical protein [Campylobacter insulaenigrae]|uniref:hypothetical protein n=1 Tax=Campylobacter insulaenigrae TaxID=260714 RepID=UPI00242CCA3F|nr:hypothetical protein [Campylobacter insulaenigrae]